METKRYQERLTPDNAALLLIDHQVGLFTGVRDIPVAELKHNVVALAKAIKVLSVLIIAGVSTEVCLAFPAIFATGIGYDAYAVIDASGTFSETKRITGLIRMVQAGVIVSDYATVAVEMLKDNASSKAGELYAALDMPFASLIGQLAGAFAKDRAA